MSSMLELVLAERAAQAEEEGRPPFTSVEDLRRFILHQTPPPYVNISLEMCILSVQEHDSYWRLELIDKRSCTDFHELSSVFEHLDSHPRNRFIFQLTLWKNRNRLLNNVQCREGFAYQFTKVHASTMRYGCPCGRIQVREGFTAARLTDSVPVTPVNTFEPSLSGIPQEQTEQSSVSVVQAVAGSSGSRSGRTRQDHRALCTCHTETDYTDVAPEISEDVPLRILTRDGALTRQHCVAQGTTPTVNTVSDAGPHLDTSHEEQNSPKRKTRDVEPHELPFASPSKRPRARPQKSPTT